MKNGECNLRFSCCLELWWNQTNIRGCLYPKKHLLIACGLPVKKILLCNTYLEYLMNFPHKINKVPQKTINVDVKHFTLLQTKRPCMAADEKVWSVVKLLLQVKSGIPHTISSNGEPSSTFPAGWSLSSNQTCRCCFNWNVPKTKRREEKLKECWFLECVGFEAFLWFLAKCWFRKNERNFEKLDKLGKIKVDY